MPDTSAEEALYNAQRASHARRQARAGTDRECCCSEVVDVLAKVADCYAAAQDALARAGRKSD